MKTDCKTLKAFCAHFRRCCIHPQDAKATFDLPIYANYGSGADYIVSFWVMDFQVNNPNVIIQFDDYEELKNNIGRFFETLPNEK